MSERRGIVEYFGSGLASSECGYCKGQKPSGVDCSLWAHYLTADNYQKMIDRGWRRSGKYCYKPDLKKSCCPPYTIKCDALSFRLSKSQKKILNVMFRFLAFGEKGKEHIAKSQLQPLKTESESVTPQLSEKVLSEVKKCSILNNDKMQCDQVAEEVDVCMKNTSKSPGKVVDGDSTKRNKAKVVRFEKSLQKIVASKKCSQEEALLQLRQRRNARTQKHKEKSLDERINRSLPENAVHKLEIRYKSTMGNEFNDLDVTHQLYQKYQMCVHKDSPEECTSNQLKRFLIDSPFEHEEFDSENGEMIDDTLPASYGSYHMQYWLDGQLIAVGVVDVLSKCLSSVYFFYDPKYEFLSLGTYSALREISLTQKLHQRHSSIRDYYMGFYIHSCVKMCYKRKYYPSYLLCPEAFTWNPIERCLPLLNVNEYQRLELDLNKNDEDAKNIQDDDIFILYTRRAMSYSLYKLLSGNNDDSEVQEYAKLIGKRCVGLLLLYRASTLSLS